MFIRKLLSQKWQIKLFLGTLIIGTIIVGPHFVGSYDDTWTFHTEMPTPRRGLVAVVVDERIYAIGGVTYGEESGKIVEEYDPNTDTWTRRADLPTPRNGLAAAVVNGKIYTIGGIGGPNTVEVYDPGTDTWSNLAKMPTAREDLAAAVIDGKIYVIGGVKPNSNDFVNIVEEYDPVTTTWQRKANMPTARKGLVATAVGGRIYAIGGDTDDHFSMEVEAYDQTTDQWSRLEDMPTPREDPAVATVDGQIFVIGGHNSDPMFYITTVEKFDPNINKWTQQPDIQIRRQEHAAVTVGRQIYVIGGRNSDGFLGSVEVYTPPFLDSEIDTFPDTEESKNTEFDDTWETVASMLAPRSRHVSVVVDNKIYVMGGWDINSHDLATVEVYDPVTNKWESRKPMPAARSYFAAAVVAGKVYTFGGKGSPEETWTDYPYIDVYDPVTDSWERAGLMSAPRTGLAVTVVENRIYAIGGGADGMEPYLSGQIVQEYDPATNTWRRRADMPIPRHHFVAATVGGKIYAIGGDVFISILDGYNNDANQTVEEYNPNTDTWRRVADMSTERKHHSGAVIGGRIYVIGGEDKYQKTYPNRRLATVEEYNPDSNNWITRTSMAFARLGLSAAEAGGMIYATGGWNNRSYYAHVERYDPPFFDTDGDSLADDEELRYRTDPLVADFNVDTDGDGIPNLDEVNNFGTNPSSPDSDGDSFLDGEEVTFGTDPNDTEEFPPLTDLPGSAPPLPPTSLPVDSLTITVDKPPTFFVSGFSFLEVFLAFVAVLMIIRRKSQY